MLNTLTIILAVVQIIVFIFFGWLGALQLRDYYRDRKSDPEINKPTQAEAQLYFESEKYIMAQIHHAYVSGVQNGLRSKFNGEMTSTWKDVLPEYESNIHETIETITGAKYY